MCHRVDTVMAYISIHALLAESDVTGTLETGITVISIHALLAESDRLLSCLIQHAASISIHALLAESDWTRY